MSIDLDFGRRDLEFVSTGVSAAFRQLFIVGVELSRKSGSRVIHYKRLFISYSEVYYRNPNRNV